MRIHGFHMIHVLTLNTESKGPLVHQTRLVENTPKVILGYHYCYILLELLPERTQTSHEFEADKPDPWQIR